MTSITLKELSDALDHPLSADPVLFLCGVRAGRQSSPHRMEGLLGLVGVMALLLLGGVLGHLSDAPARLQGLCLLLFGSAQLAGLFFRWDNARRRRQ
ncbi:hypothetical protein ACU6QD_03970 [Corynebacterium glucuronolyticum]